LTIATDRALAAARGLTRLDLDLLAYVPSNTIAPIINAFRLNPETNKLCRSC
jgi:hypothetical protein